MKTGKTLPELVATLEAQAKVKRDFVAPANAIRITSYSGLTQLSIGEDYPMTDTALSQVAEYAGVPRPLVDRLLVGREQLRVPASFPPYDEPDTALLDVLLTTLVQSKGTDRRMIRTLDGWARACLSNRYLRLDHTDVLDVVLHVLTSGELDAEFSIASCEITANKLFLKVVAPEVKAEVAVGDVVTAGLIISNSETGLGAVSVQPFTCRLICQNGMTHTEYGLRKTHLGKALAQDGEAAKFFQADTVEQDAKAYLLKIRDVIRACFRPETFAEIVGLYREAATTRLEGDMVKITELTATRLRLSESERSSVLRNLVESGSLTLWSLANSVTQAAEQVECYERASELEALGSKLLMLPAGELHDLTHAVGGGG